MARLPLQRLAAGCLAAAAAWPALIEAEPLVRHQEIWMAVSDRSLDSQRGGFDLGAGLLVSFGITRAAFVNGELVAQTQLNFGQLDKITPMQAAELSRQMSALNLVQNGPGNSAPDTLGPMGGTVIQNTLNNQNIANHTVINANTNGMSLMKDLNTATTITDAIARSVGGR
ncbi:hypothetical protein QTH91_06855 [Variovorax dokdonensis]|uniref:Uncharacterized protein n=1 Tax=Variovorax dokdonensis TaxID=344883 RepID=A0ABT7N8E1_9BURK|nr:hypothetical protein [Variovorax dokdonensis]MDM0044196.1 hypothetical protein [Variovorax dokdonensis]